MISLRRLTTLANLLLLPAVLLGSSTPPELGEFRTWTQTGGVKIEAGLKGIEGDKIILQAKDGRVASFAVSGFSSSDHAFLKAKLNALVLPFLNNPGLASPAQSGWSKPISVEPSLCAVQVTSPGGGGQRCSFQSRHFTFTAPADFDATAMSDTAEFFQVVRELHRVSPWGILTPPSKGDRYEIELYEQASEFVAPGSPGSTLTDYDKATRTLKCSFAALGIERIDNRWVKSEHPQSSRNAARAVSLMMMHDVIGTIPEWLFNGVCQCVADTPIVGTTAWCEMPPTPRTFKISKSESKLTEALTSMLSPPSTGEEAKSLVSAAVEKLSQIVFENQLSRLVAHHFIHWDPDGKAPALTAMLLAAREDGVRWEAYQKGMAVYQSEWEKLKQNPLVKEVSEGRYQFPDSLTAPEAPAIPHPVKSMSEVPFLHLGKLIGNSTPAAAAAAILENLKKKGF